MNQKTGCHGNHPLNYRENQKRCPNSKIIRNIQMRYPD